MPGVIPTQYQNTKKNSFTDADLKMPASSMTGLYNAAEQAKSEKGVHDRLQAAYGSIDPKDAPMRDAQKTLDATQTTQAKLSHAGADAEAEAAQNRAIEASSYVRPVADATQEVTGLTSMIPGPVGWGSEGAFALAGLGRAADPKSSANGFERALDAGGSLLPLALSGSRALGKAASKASTEIGLQSPGITSEVGSAFADKQSSIPPVRHYWDALDLGQEPAQAAKIGAGRDKGSLSALEGLQQAGKEGRFNKWARKNVDELDLSGARSVPTDPAISVPTDGRITNDFSNLTREHPVGAVADEAFDANLNPVGNQPKRIADMLAHPGSQKWQADQYAKNHDIAVSILGDQVRTPAEMAARSGPVALPPTPGKAESVGLQRALEILKAKESPSLQALERTSPADALAAGDEASKRSVLFGGVGSKQAGKHVSPTKRSPVGVGK